MVKMTGSKYFAETMRVGGVTHVFFVPVVLTPALVEMERGGIVPVTTHSEKAAAYMADGYARVARRPGICLSQTIGAANLAAGLRDAYLASSPVIAVTGGKSPTGKYRHVYQEIDDFSVFEPLTKYNVQVDSPSRLPDLLRQALRSATTGRLQPVHLECAGNLGQAIEGETDVVPVFEKRFFEVPPFRPQADPADVKNAAERLAGAKRPTIIIGGGVKWSAAEAEVLELAGKLSIPVATSLNGKDAICEDDPLSIGVVGVYSRTCANRIVAESDLVFYIGSLTGSMVTNNWQIPRPGTAVIQLDIDADNLGRNFPNVASLCGDAKAVVRQLIQATGPPCPRDAWLARCNELVSQWRSEVEPLVSSSAVPLRPERICKELSEALPADAILVADTGYAGMWAGVYGELRYPTQTFIRAAGSLGWAFPAAIGAKCAAADRPVVCFIGDGGFYYHMAEMETAVRYGINVVTVVNNNRALGMTREYYEGDVPARGSEMWRFEDVNFAEVAQTMGCLGIRVEKPGEVRPAIEQALAANRPAIIDVVSDMNIMAPMGWLPKESS